MRAPGALLVFVLACSSPAPPAPSAPAASAPAAAASSGSAQAQGSVDEAASEASQGAQATPGEPRAVTAAYRLRARDDGARDLLVTVKPAGIERVVGRIPPEHRCIAGEASNTGPEGRGFVVSCGLARLSSVHHRGNSALITVAGGEPTTVALPDGAFLQIETKPGPLDDPASDKGCQKSPLRKEVIPFSTAVRPNDDPSQGQVLVLRSPGLGVEVEIGKNDQSYCHGRYDPVRRAYSAFCATAWVSSSLLVESLGDGLYFSSVHSGYDSRGAGPVGGVRFPCGAEARFPRLHRVAPGYSSQAGRCDGICGSEHDLCEDRCIEARPAPVESQDPRPGCLERCETAQKACASRCPR